MSNYYVDPNWCYENPNEAAAELERLQRANREQAELLDQIYQYVDEQCLAMLGQPRVKALIEAHRAAFSKGKQVFDDLRRVEAQRDQLVQLVDMLLEGVSLNKRLFIALREAATTDKEYNFLARAVTANTQLLAAGRLGKSSVVGGSPV